MPEHVDILDPEIHEPKGVAAAAAGTMYIANGSGSGTWKALTTKRVWVNAKADLPAPSAGVITLAAGTEYTIANDVSLGTDTLAFGNNTSLNGITSLGVTLTYTGTGDMMTFSDVNSRVSNMTLSCANGRLINWACTATVVFRMNDVSITSCDRFGTFSSVGGILRFTNVSPAAVTTGGLTFSGDYRSFLWEVSAFTINGGTAFALGTATFDSFIIDTVLDTLAAGTTFLSGATSSANINAGGVGLVRTLRNSGTGTILSGISTDDALWEFWHNDDILDTRPDGLVHMQSNATNTVISVAGTYVLVAGTWVVDSSSQVTATVAGRFTYNGGKDAKLPLTAVLTLNPVSGTGKSISARIAKNGTTIAGSEVNQTIDATSPKQMTLVWQDTATSGDFYEVHVTNNTDTVDILVSSAIFRLN